jgi:hypothetical protein
MPYTSAAENRKMKIKNFSKQTQIEMSMTWLREVHDLTQNGTLNPKNIICGWLLLITIKNVLNSNSLDSNVLVDGEATWLLYNFWMRFSEQSFTNSRRIKKMFGLRSTKWALISNKCTICFCFYLRLCAFLIKNRTT